MIPIGIILAVLVGVVLALSGTGTALNVFVARWRASRWTEKERVQTTWGRFWKANVLAIFIALGAFVLVYGGALAGRSLLGVRDLPGPPAPGWGGPPGWYSAVCILSAIVSAALTDVVVFLWFYRRKG